MTNILVLNCFLTDHQRAFSIFFIHLANFIYFMNHLCSESVKNLDWKIKLKFGPRVLWLISKSWPHPFPILSLWICAGRTCADCIRSRNAWAHVPDRGAWPGSLGSCCQCSSFTVISLCLGAVLCACPVGQLTADLSCCLVSHRCPSLFIKSPQIISGKSNPFFQPWRWENILLVGND